MRRPPRREVSAGRSTVWRSITAGVTLSTVTRRSSTVLTRPIVRGLVALSCMSVLLLAPTPAHAQTAQERLSETRRAIDTAAQHFFDAQNHAAMANERMHALEHEITGAEARVASAKTIATRRALLIYEGASVQYASVLGDSPIDSARRVQLIDHANARNFEAIDELKASLDQLHAQRKTLAAERVEQDRAVRAAASQRAALDATLTSLRAEVRSEAAADAARRRSSSSSSTSTSPATRSSNGGSTTTSPGSSNNANNAPPPPPPPSGNGVSAHHNDPFLVCTRQRESGGDYAVVSADGYYGAYQFLPSTWDAIASHAGRMDLVGVLPNRASEYDQDEMAWALLQWQGKAPWGGRC